MFKYLVPVFLLFFLFMGCSKNNNTNSKNDLDSEDDSQSTTDTVTGTHNNLDNNIVDTENTIIDDTQTNTSFCIGDPCDDNATCDDSDRTVVCSCNEGWTGDGLVCEDINECALGLDNCDATYGTCTNIPGSFTCGCLAGYHLSGTTCIADEACLEGEHRTGSTVCGINERGYFQQQCINNNWVNTDTCMDNDHCLDGETRQGSTSCGLNNNGLLRQRCTNGQWVNTTTCLGETTDTDIANPRHILGADISFVQEREDQGYVFVENGNRMDVFQMLKNHGFNYIRLRLFHDPGQPHGYQYEFNANRAEPYCDINHTIEMAKRVKAAGMGFLLDFHYSDTWADPGVQSKPAAWEGLNFTQLRQAMYNYTRNSLLAFLAAGALPDMVQVGNEITPGMLHPDGHTYEPNNWDQLALLLKEGLDAVKSVDSRIKTMIHLDRGADYSTTTWWLNEATRRDVHFDILGQSCYTNYHGPFRDWESTFHSLELNWPDLEFVIAEYADSYRKANDLMFNMEKGLGTFIWEPTVDGQWGEALFDTNWRTREFAPRSSLYLYDQMATDYGLW